MRAEDRAAFDRAYLEERLIVQATEGLWAALEQCGAKKADIADKLGVRRSHVTQTLNGRRNLTLKTLAAFAWALDAEVTLEIRPAEFNERFAGGSSVLETTDPESPKLEPRLPRGAKGSYSLAA